MSAIDIAIPRLEWRTIPGFVGYEVSNTGLVRSILKGKGRKNRILPGTIYYQANGRPLRVAVTLRREGKNVVARIHRLVLLAFVGPVPPGMECCHFDGDATNNYLSNLRWDTRLNNQRDSIRHGTHSKPPVLYQGMSIRHRSRKCQQST